MGTKITYKSAGRNPDGDNRINLRGVQNKPYSFQKAFADPEYHFMYVTDYETYGINKLVSGKKKFLLIEPNPVTFYFSTAHDIILQVDEARELLNSNISPDPSNMSGLPVPFSYVFKVVSIGVVFTCLAVEAFMNQVLPDHQPISFKGKQLTKQKLSDG